GQGGEVGVDTLERVGVAAAGEVVALVAVLVHRVVRQHRLLLERVLLGRLVVQDDVDGRGAFALQRVCEASGVGGQGGEVLQRPRPVHLLHGGDEGDAGED